MSPRTVDTLQDLPPLRDVIAQFGLRADKGFGQHFLLDLNLTARIARYAEQAGPPLSQSVAIEVGPGPGGLTRALLNEGVGHVLAVEADERFTPALDAIGAAAPGRLSVVYADALKTDLAALSADRAPGLTPVVVSNLPYNVGTALLTGWLTRPAWWARLTLMFQREVADRIVAAPGAAAYGRLAVLAALRSAPEFGFPVTARAFTPPPKVESAVVRIDPKGDGTFADVRALERLTQAAFSQRRKMLRRSLKSLAAGADISMEALCAAAGVTPDARPETVTPNQFAAMARALR